MDKGVIRNHMVNRMKLSKPFAGYARSTDEKKCKVCRFMHHDGSCDVVQGEVSPNFTCDWWATRKFKLTGRARPRRKHKRAHA